MALHQFGINIDAGIALSTPAEFDHLYIQPDTVVVKKILAWLSQGEKAVLLGGQIGCGKTTLIAHAFYQSKVEPDLTFYFDKARLNLSLIDSWSIVFAEIFRYLAVQKLTHLEEIPAEFRPILGESAEQWLASIALIRLEVFSSAAMASNTAFDRVLADLLDFLPNLYQALMFKMAEHRASPLLCYAAGIDKFEPGTAAYFSLGQVLAPLAKHKTLFEVNAVHLFWHDTWAQNVEKFFIPAATDDWMAQMLAQRLGTYAVGYVQEVALIARFSGGISRQALRILDYFLRTKKHEKSNKKAFILAVQNVNRDFFSYGNRPESALLRAIDQTESLETSMISLPGDNATALRAIFGNWVYLYAQLHDSRWEARLNPVIKNSFSPHWQDAPEMALLKKYAQKQGMSDQGLSIDRDMPGWENGLLEHIETTIELNVIEILDVISSALFSKHRNDRIVIAYENQAIADIVKTYLAAKSNSYEYQIWQHTPLCYQQDCPLLQQIVALTNNHKVDIISIQFEGDFPDEEIKTLNLKRDALLTKQMIWWIPKDKLNHYFSNWVQLRQLFQLYVLDEDIQRSLSIEDIEADLAFMQELADEENAAFAYVKNLKGVLAYLKATKHG